MFTIDPDNPNKCSFRINQVSNAAPEKFQPSGNESVINHFWCNQALALCLLTFFVTLVALDWINFAKAPILDASWGSAPTPIAIDKADHCLAVATGRSVPWCGFQTTSRLRARS
ncbi:hypothetical protein [uncultured Roseobacter sp.]|uniref:hypothetical protein n=1 Tax=uncultured Roseobacter sp. TaxID=114847 RepID=UPI002602956B|nr:hypothetical protein [uncultured Roseobacter sp.]